jgi:hypothetical protein
MVRWVSLGYPVKMNSLIARMPDQLIGGIQNSKTHQLLLVEIAGRARAELTELIARLALHGSFFLIAGGEWLPDQDSMRRAVRRHTTAIEETLERVSLARPSTCLQLRAQLEDARSLSRMVLIFDFFHHFYDPDIDLSLRQRVLEECCQGLENLSRSRSAFVIVERLPVEEYNLFFPILASIADETLEVEIENLQPEERQSSLF